MEDSRSEKANIIYDSPKGVPVKVEIDETNAWLTQSQIAELFGIGRTTVTKSISKIIKSGDVCASTVCVEWAHTASDGKTYNTKFYNLDIILFIGYKHDFKVALDFRQFCQKNIGKSKSVANATNEYYWFERISKATLKYCREFLKLSDYPVYDEKIKEYMSLIIRLRKSNADEETVRREAESKSVFPEEIRGYICHYGGERIFQPNHLMCKLAVLRDEINRINYEFLIEYDIFDPSTEIYYGIKAISDDSVSNNDFIKNAEREWIGIRDFNKERSEKNKEKKKRGDFYATNRHRFKETDNSNNGTFWPFWIRYKEGESLSKVVYNLSTVFNDYKENSKTPLSCLTEKFDEIYEIIKNKSFDNRPYEELENYISDNLTQKSVDEFRDVILPNLEKRKMIVMLKDKRYELRCNLNLLSTYMMAIFSAMRKRRIKEHEPLEYSYVPYEILCTVILTREGKKTNRSSWDNKVDNYEEIEKEVESWFENYN